MTFDAFISSRIASRPPANLSPALTALWWDAKGDWEQAHQAAQSEEGPDGAWVHAYLHRKQGDLSNAGYWYRQAGRPIASGPAPSEWNQIARALLEEDEPRASRR